MTARCAPELNQSVIYMVLCDYRDGPAWAERPVDRTNKRDTAADIRSGELPRVLQVIEIEFGVTHGLRGSMNSRDVTEDFVVDGRPVQTSPPEASAEAFRQMLIDHERDLRKEGLFGW